jgi:FSR family fosmidomycin resistance protein-like MFS transporter
MNLPRQRLFWAVSLGHMTNDTFISMSSVLLAFISVNVLPMSTVQIGAVLSVTALLGALAQPFFGWLADRSGGRLLGAGGVAWTVGLTLLAVLAAEGGYFWPMVLAFIIPAIGSGAFHPVGTMYAAASDKRYAASNLSYFFLMGQLGLALGPALAGLLLNQAASSNHIFTDPFSPIFGGRLIERGTVTPILSLAVFAIPGILMMAFLIPNQRAHQKARIDKPAVEQQRVGFPIGAFAILIAMVALRSLAQPGSVNFIPVLFQHKGWSPAEYGLITSSFWLASGFAGVFFGNLADRYDRRRVVAVSLILSAPAFFLLPLTNGALAFALAILAGGLSGGSHSVIVLAAQELLPSSKAFASGMILGLIFGTGAVGSFLIGALSESIGLEMVFHLVAGAIVIASLLALLLPAGRSNPVESRPENAEAVPTRA